jgi:hypothetical protein
MRQDDDAILLQGFVLSFLCCRCGESFQSLPPPADTRPDEPNPMCIDCIERALDEVEPEPISQEEIDSIVARVTGRDRRS